MLPGINQFTIIFWALFRVGLIWIGIVNINCQVWVPTDTQIDVFERELDGMNKAKEILLNQSLLLACGGYSWTFKRRNSVFSAINAN